MITMPACIGRYLLHGGLSMSQQLQAFSDYTNDQADLVLCVSTVVVIVPSSCSMTTRSITLVVL